MTGYPVNGLRHPSIGDSCGWYIWAGGEINQDDPNFFRPVHVAHLAASRPELIAFLALPSGWRFQFAPGHEDTWFDPALLAIE
jgi:hypothetical protein